MTRSKANYGSSQPDASSMLNHGRKEMRRERASGCENLSKKFVVSSNSGTLVGVALRSLLTLEPFSESVSAATAVPVSDGKT